MRLFLHALATSALWLSGSGSPAQAPAPTPPDATNSSTRPSAMTRPSEILQGPLTSLQQALAGVRLEKWKMSGESRDAMDEDIRSIERDFQDTLPPLLATADSEPGSVAKVLPAIRNVDALYDVALRVSAVGRLTAPAQQSAVLEQALRGLQEARRKVGDQLQAAAVAEETRIGDLQTSLRASQAAAAAAATPPPATAATTKPVAKPKKRIKPKPVPAPAAAVPTDGTSTKQP